MAVAPGVHEARYHEVALHGGEAPVVVLAQVMSYNEESVAFARVAGVGTTGAARPAAAGCCGCGGSLLLLPPSRASCTCTTPSEQRCSPLLSRGPQRLQGRPDRAGFRRAARCRAGGMGERPDLLLLLRRPCTTHPSNSPTDRPRSPRRQVSFAGAAGGGIGQVGHRRHRHHRHHRRHRRHRQRQLRSVFVPALTSSVHVAARLPGWAGRSASRCATHSATHSAPHSASRRI